MYAARSMCRNGNILREYRQLISRNEFKLCISACIALASLNFLLGLPPAQSVFSFELPSAAQKAMIYNSGIGQAIIVCLLPLLCSMSYADSYTVEKESGYRMAVQIRAGRARYFWGKAVVVATGSFVIAMLPFLLDQLFCLLAYPLASADNAFHLSAYEHSMYDEIVNAHFPDLHMNAPYLNNLAHILLNGLYGGVLGFLTFAISLHTKRGRIVVLSSTTILTLVMYILLSWGNLRSFIPYMYLFSAPVAGGGVVIHFFFVTALLFLLGLVLVFLKVEREDL